MDDLYDEFLKIETFANRPSVECLNILGSIVDSASDDRHRRGLEHAIRLADTIVATEYTDEHQTLVDYYVANAWSALKQLRSPEMGGSWEWEQPEIEKELFHIRRARRSSGFSRLPAIRKCQILTNEGNCLDNLGRFVEALKPWNTALSIDSEFGMASGNRGIGLWTYANSLYDRDQMAVLASTAWRELESKSLHGVDANAMYCFQRYREEIEARIQEQVLRQDWNLNPS